MIRNIEKDVLLSKLGSVFAEIARDKKMRLDDIQINGGVSRRSISRYSQGISDPSICTVWKTCMALETNPAIVFMEMDWQIKEETIYYLMKECIMNRIDIDEFEDDKLVKRFCRKIFFKYNKSKNKKF